jgi:hypothetical protein
MALGRDVAGGAGGGDIRGVRLVGGCEHAVGVCDDGDKAGEGERFMGHQFS